MAILNFNGEAYTVDHAVKGADYVHGYDANGNIIVNIEGVSDFSLVTYDGEFMQPETCLEEHCNEVRHVGDSLMRRDGTKLPPDKFGAAPAGYGLGETCKNIDSVFDITRNGWWVTNGDTPNNVWLLCHSITTNGGKDITITGWDISGTNWYKITKKSNVWGSWKTMLEAIGAAPAGYGLGANLVSETGYKQVNHAEAALLTETGIYWFRDDVNPFYPDGWNSGTMGLLIHYQHNLYSTTAAKQIFIPYYKCGVQDASGPDNYVVVERTKRQTDGTWTPIEWRNPPMQLGVEYRTTERYMGLPVYTQLVSAGNLPNATTRTVNTTELENPIYYILSVHGRTTVQNRTIPHGNYISARGGYGNITLETTSDYSDDTAELAVRYYKPYE